MSPDARYILQQALGAHAKRRKHLWGDRNFYTASTVSPALQELLEAGLLVKDMVLTTTITSYRATADGMRAVGMGPAAIEKTSKLHMEGTE